MKQENEAYNSLSSSEKKELRDRIMHSALRIKARKRNSRILLSTAATLALLFGISLFFERDTEPSIQDFVKTSPHVDLKNAEGVTLILGEGENLNLNGDNSSIKYSQTGKEVDLGSGKTVNQESVIHEKSIFNTLVVPYGKRTDVQLSDGTVVWLNSGSKLVYPAVFSGKSREVYLEGEAIFEVTHDPKKPFRVISHTQEIEVLGTVFNVSHYNDDELMNTVLKSGSVQVSYKDDDRRKVKLNPGTMASFNPKTLNVQTKQVNVEDHFSWREGFLKLKNDNLKFIMTKLSRYYNIEILIASEELGGQTFSGNLDIKEDVNKVIHLIRETTDFKIETNENQIILTN